MKPSLHFFGFSLKNFFFLSLSRWHTLLKNEMKMALKSPVTSKSTTEGNDKRVMYGASSMQGWRPSKFVCICSKEDGS